MSTAETQSHDEGAFFWRFSVLHRFFHLVVLVSFTLLALTGLPLKFSGCPLSQWVLFIFGGVDGAGAVHRFMGIVTFGYVILHLVWLCYYKVVLKGSLFGPQSMMPRLKDFQDLVQNIKYFLGKRNPAQVRAVYLLGKIRLPGRLLGRSGDRSFRVWSYGSPNFSAGFCQVNF